MVEIDLNLDILSLIPEFSHFLFPLSNQGPGNKGKKFGTKIEFHKLLEIKNL
jgi:hypothetical protein